VPPALRERMVMVKEAADLSSSNFAQAMAYRYFAQYPWRETLKELRVIYRERRDAMLGALEEEFPPGVRWTRPTGGFYVWADLGSQLDTRSMLAKAITARVAYVPGGAFYADGQGASCLRLSYCYPTPDEIREGVRRLAGVIEQEFDLLRALGGVPTPDEDVDNTPPAGWGGV
jgi:2-aminoadipate transaminase